MSISPVLHAAGRASRNSRPCATQANNPDAIDGLAAPRPGPASASNSNLVLQVVSHLETNYTETVTLRDLERVTAANAYRIIRAFRDHLGTTPHAYLMRLRVRRATALLRAGETIIAAAVEAGFFDQSHFTKHFKRVYGITPGEYLRRGAKEPSRARGAELAN